jgi:hypothetical protein
MARFPWLDWVAGSDAAAPGQVVAGGAAQLAQFD